MKLTLILAVLAALLHGYAYVLYSVRAQAGTSEPNAATWFLWAFLAILNATSYHQMSDWVAALQMYTGSIACAMTFFYVWWIGKFERPTQEEWNYIAVGIIAGLVWWYFRNAAIANMIVLGAFAVSFVPLFKAVRLNPKVETVQPWVIWTTAYLITSVNNGWLKHVAPVALITPLLMVAAHGSIAILASRGERRKIYC